MFTIITIGLAVFSIIKIILFFYSYQRFERKQKRKVESTDQQKQAQENDAVPSLTIKINLCSVISHENLLNVGSLFLP